MSAEFDTGYPSEPIGGGNPYYRCVHCKISDPQINGTIKNHAPDCEYRLSKENNMSETKKTVSDLTWEEKMTILELMGWEVECESPFEIRNGESFATNQAATIVMVSEVSEYLEHGLN